MKNNILKIAVAAFFHDIGKFALSEFFETTLSPDDYKHTLYRPKNDKGNYSHIHALNTALFIEKYSKWLPHELNYDHQNNLDCFCNLAAMHHKPETVLQSIITEADCMTSEIDRQQYSSEDMDVNYKKYLKSRLIPIFENIFEKKLKENYNYQYPLQPLSPTNIFPEKTTEHNPQKAKQDYENLFQQFSEELKKLKHQDNLSLWFEHFESLAMFYLSAIPAARAGKVTRDVSLYDHLRLTSAFASALYMYHDFTNTLEEKAIKSDRSNKFLMISGNFFGIQSFIFKGYGDTRKYRARLLRGRSFYVSLLVELAANMLCRESGLPLTSIILNAGGIFTILAPNIQPVKDAIDKTQKTINKWLMAVSYGELSIGFSSVVADKGDFLDGKFTQLWDKMVNAMSFVKCQKIDLNLYGGEVNDYLDQFSKGDADICKICGIRPVTQRIAPEMTEACSLCKDHISIGTKLVKHQILAILNKDTPSQPGILAEPIFDCYQLRFDNEPVIESSNILHYWDISYHDDQNSICLKNHVTRKIINAYVPTYEPDDQYDDRLQLNKLSVDEKEHLLNNIEKCNPKQFQTLAQMATRIDSKNNINGTAALGILKADVDNLAMIMGCGLPEKQYTLSRIATLSRLMNNFFALFLPSLLFNEYKNVYTVFGGGDDLFLIGPHNTIYELVFILQEEFSRYVCENPKIHFSAGIIVQKPNIPLDTAAESAEHSLEQSKSSGRKRLTMFEHTIEWQDLAPLNEIKDRLQEWMDKGYFSSSMLYKLNEFIQMAAKEKIIIHKIDQGVPVDFDDMQCLKWRSMLKYFSIRNIKQDLSEDLIKDMASSMTQWLADYHNALKLPLWSLLYERRKTTI